MEKRYLQLYSLGESLQKDFVGSLEKVANMGYTGVEFAGGYYGDMTATDLKAKLAELGLEPISSHIMLEMIPGQIDYAVELGLKYLIVPAAIFGTEVEAKDLAEKLNEVGSLCKEKGVKLGYHNHRHEFMPSEDGTLLETLLKYTDPDLVCFQLDVGWATCSGIDCPEFIKKYAGRICMIHVKECSTVAGPEPMMDFFSFPRDEKGMPVIPKELLEKMAEENKWNVPSGEGIIDWKAVKEAADAQGAEAYIIEREYCYGDNIFDCVEADCNYLKSL